MSQTSQMRHLTRGMKISGIVFEGRGEASGFTQLDWVRDQCRAKFGFDPFPGTLNVLTDDAEAVANARALPGILIEPDAPAFCAAKALRVTINDRLPAVWIIPDVPGYPANQIELIADRSLREALNLKNGDRVEIDLSANLRE